MVKIQICKVIYKSITIRKCQIYKSTNTYIHTYAVCIVLWVVGWFDLDYFGVVHGHWSCAFGSILMSDVNGWIYIKSIYKVLKYLNNNYVIVYDFLIYITFFLTTARMCVAIWLLTRITGAVSLSAILRRLSRFVNGS